MSKLTKEEIEEIRIEFTEWQKQKPDQRTNVSVGKAIGYDRTTVSRFKNGNYPDESSEPIALKIKNHIESQKQYNPDGTIKSVFAQTSAADEVFMTIDFSCTFNKTTLIIGDPGGGKTIALKEYRDRQQSPLYIESKKTTNMKSVIFKLCDALKIDPYEGTLTDPTSKRISLDDNVDKITNKLVDSQRPIMLDESEHLHVPELEIIRRIQDFTGIPLILSGTSQLEKTLRGKRGHELQQLSSRIAMKTEIPLLVENDTRLILSANYPEAEEFYTAFHYLCKQNGRYLENLINLVKYAILRGEKKITEDLIYDASKKLLQMPN